MDTVLHNPDLYRQFVVKTDASERGVGAVGLWLTSVINCFQERYTIQR